MLLKSYYYMSSLTLKPGDMQKISGREVKLAFLP